MKKKAENLNQALSFKKCLFFYWK